MGRGLFYLSFFLLLAGGGCSAAGTILKIRRQRERVFEKETRAKVVELLLREDASSQGGFRNKYYPVFQYYANGKLCEFVHSEGAYPAAWKIGQSVRIAYDPSDPTRFVIRKPAPEDFLPDVLRIGGMVIMLAGAILFLRFALR